MNNSVFDIQPLLPDLVSIGIAFGREKPKIPADIEQTIIKALPFLRSDLKVLNLLITWASEMGDLVHVERLKALANELDSVDVAFLGAISRYTQAKFRKWNLISVFSKKKLPRNFSYKLPAKMTLAVDYGQCPAEESFKKFGLIVPTVLLSDHKKLIPRKYLVEDNLRFKLRALFGTNWRADIAYLMFREKNINASQISKQLRCSYETAHRIKRSFEESNLRDLNLI
jgi:hypothetical protein